MLAWMADGAENVLLHNMSPHLVDALLPGSKKLLSRGRVHWGSSECAESLNAVVLEGYRRDQLGRPAHLLPHRHGVLSIPQWVLRRQLLDARHLETCGILQSCARLEVVSLCVHFRLRSASCLLYLMLPGSHYLYRSCCHMLPFEKVEAQTQVRSGLAKQGLLAATFSLLSIFAPAAGLNLTCQGPLRAAEYAETWKWYG